MSLAFAILFKIVSRFFMNSLFQMDDIKNNYKFKQGEIFKRMKCSTFVQLVLQVIL